MAARKGSRRLVFTLLWAGLMGLVIAAALTPSSGAVNAQSNCQYGNCTLLQNTTFQYLLIGAVLFAVFLGAIALAVALSRRRRGGGSVGYVAPVVPMTPATPKPLPVEPVPEPSPEPVPAPIATPEPTPPAATLEPPPSDQTTGPSS